ncbi:MAG: OpgC domain-containing protein [Azospirillum sp.]|nr:OpgC domain-containing protein [Azospirillum sp.]
MARPASTRQRDLRLDFFRGLALIFIFLDHVPSNFVSWVTIRNFGFSDATEIFIFISGYTAALAYGSALREHGFPYAAARIMHRVWQLYVAHIFLFVLFTAQIAYVAQTFDNPMYTEEMKVVDFLSQPHASLVQALLLKFRPRNMDILPLYMVLLIGFPGILWLLHRRPWMVLVGSAALYAAARIFDWNLPTYPSGTWFFNPLCWQFLFVIGAFFGRRHGAPTPLAPNHPALTVAAALYLAFAFLVVLTWHFAELSVYLPNWLGRLLYPIDKTNLDLLRLVHFLAVGYLVVRMVGPQAGFLSWRVAAPLRACGKQSLQVFCVGTVLAFAGHFVLVEIDESLAAQLAVSIAGAASMIGVAYVLAWYQAMEKAPPRVRSVKQPLGDVASMGGAQ